MGALALLKSDIRPIGLVHGRRGGPGWLKLLACCGDIPRFMTPNLEEKKAQDALLELAPTLLVSSFYPRRIPVALLNKVPGLNVHPSDLPRWRGPDPCTWTIFEGDQRTAICIHWLTEEIDEGDILDRHPIMVKPRESAGSLSRRLETLGAQRMAAVVARLRDGQDLPSVPQRGSITWAPIHEPEFWEIDWRQDAVAIDRFVRAAAPFPGAYTGLGDELLVVISGAPVNANAFQSLDPGTPFIASGVTHIRCGTGAFRLGRLRLGRRQLTGRRLTDLLI